jgi:hypothetical protein
MGKRGIGHLEVILSFVIFIAAVGFALYLFNPTHTSKLVDSSLSYTLDEIKNNISSEVSAYSVKINNVGGAINNPNSFIAVNLSKITGNVIVTNLAGQVLPSKSQIIGGDLIVQFNNSANIWPEESLVKVFVSENYLAYSPIPSANVEVNNDFYNLASVSKKRVFLENAALELNKSYWSNYSKLKEEFKISGAEFGFNLVFLNGLKIDSSKAVPRGFEVFSDNEKIEVLRNNNLIETAELVVRVW